MTNINANVTVTPNQKLNLFLLLSFRAIWAMCTVPLELKRTTVFHNGSQEPISLRLCRYIFSAGPLTTAFSPKRLCSGVIMGGHVASNSGQRSSPAIPLAPSPPNHGTANERM